MLNPNQLRLNAEQVSAQILDGDAVMINLSNGFYYSMSNVGAFIWERMVGGYTLDAIVDSLTQRYDVSVERARADLEALVAQLLEENLVLPANAEPQLSETSSPVNEPKLPYAPPMLDIYRDIGHLVALDPPMPGLKDLPWSEPADSSRGQPT